MGRRTTSVFSRMGTKKSWNTTHSPSAVTCTCGRTGNPVSMSTELYDRPPSRPAGPTAPPSRHRSRSYEASWAGLCQRRACTRPLRTRSLRGWCARCQFINRHGLCGARMREPQPQLTSNSMNSEWLSAAFWKDSSVFSRTLWPCTLEAPEPRCLQRGGEARQAGGRDGQADARRPPRRASAAAPASARRPPPCAPDIQGASAWHPTRALQVAQVIGGVGQRGDHQEGGAEGASVAQVGRDQGSRDGALQGLQGGAEAGPPTAWQARASVPSTG